MKILNAGPMLAVILLCAGCVPEENPVEQKTETSGPERTADIPEKVSAVDEVSVLGDVKIMPFRSWLRMVKIEMQRYPSQL
ncbi:hypothetical protein EGM51_05500 [Verrucomicrobia bacterium S94]|nr:hypothetical protein EGM51_05500 [Verrucomicrobia bacterium S94]